MAALKVSNHASHQARPDSDTGYISNIEDIRQSEYPSLKSTTYLDHAGTTLYAVSLIDEISMELKANLFGNPHSASASSQLTTRKIDDVRLQVLRFFNASPDAYDVVFTANATAAIKLVGDALRDLDDEFEYAYHVESHTSMVGLRELAKVSNHCFETESGFDAMLQQFGRRTSSSKPVVVGYPGQSNMTGRRPSLHWSSRVRDLRRTQSVRAYTLLDAASFACTSPIDLSEAGHCPDMMVVSFYKIFGYPDLGALFIRKDCAPLFGKRRYFGGGTVDSVVTCDDHWHAKKESSLHDRLEDGTLQFHNIIALGKAFDVHARLYGSMEVVSRHTSYLAQTCLEQMEALQHDNGKPVCKIYGRSSQDRQETLGPVISFNVLNHGGAYVSNAEVDKVCIVNDIQLRTGGLCNPGGNAANLGLTPSEVKANHTSGHRCGGENDIIQGKPTGTIRVSFGAMSSVQDVQRFVGFLKEHFVEVNYVREQVNGIAPPESAQYYVESLSVFPIKSCAAFKIPSGRPWEVGGRGLAWDREWCLVHSGSMVALSQKRYPRMALLRPSIDLDAGLLHVEYSADSSESRHLTLPLAPHAGETCKTLSRDKILGKLSSVCGESVIIEHYGSPEVVNFFTEALGVPCTLARLPTGSTRTAQIRGKAMSAVISEVPHFITLSNESPILLVSRSSVNSLNEEIKGKTRNRKAVSADSFRGNIVIAEQRQGALPETPYAEDNWSSLRIGANSSSRFDVLGPCQRCQMVCIDQKSASRGQEPFSTLSKTRRKNGKVWFGMHIGLGRSDGNDNRRASIKVGDIVLASCR